MFKNRLNRLRIELQNHKLEAMLVSSATNIAYLCGYPLFSPLEREGYLFITKGDQFVITDGRYSEEVMKLLPDYTLAENTLNNPPQRLLYSLANKYNIKQIGIEESDLKVAEYKPLKKLFKNLANLNVTNLRSLKDSDEIENIQKSCVLADEAVSFVLKKLKKGLSEREAQRIIINFLAEKGAEISFEPIVAFGANASIPHHQSDNTKLENKNGQFILIDLGAKVNGYCSDMTRTFFWGNPKLRGKKIYQSVYQSQLQAAKYIQSQWEKGRKIYTKNVDSVAKQTIISSGFIPYTHGLGHGTGLEVHEMPRLGPGSQDLLLEGMVFSIEPGIYIPDYGGVRIEDLYVLEANGLRQLSSFGKELLEL